MEATSLASGAKKKGNAVEQRERPPLNMLPARLATHRAARRLPINDDAVARIALARLDDQHPIAVDEGSGCGCRRGCQGNRHGVTLCPGLRPERVAGGSALGSECVELPPSARSVSASA